MLVAPPYLDTLFELVLCHEPYHVGHGGCKQNTESVVNIHVNISKASKGAQSTQ